MREIVDLSASQLDIVWTQGDPVVIDFTAPDVAAVWGDAFQAQVRAKAAPLSPVLGTFSVGAVVDGADLAITLTMPSDDSVLIPAGRYRWDMQEVGGVTRVGGWARVKGSVTT